MEDKLISLVKEIHFALDQTRIFSIHTHRPCFDEKGSQKFTNMGEDNQIAKDRLSKLIADCGKMKDHVNALVKGLGQTVLNNNKGSVAVLHDLCNYRKHPDPKSQHPPQGHFKPSMGEVTVVVEFGAQSGSFAGIISTSDKKTSFWDIGSRGYACIVIDAEIVDENGSAYKSLVPLVKEALDVWCAELGKNNISVPKYKELNSMEEAAKFGQHGSLFVETYDDAYTKASILTSEKRFDDAIVLYGYALTKCANDDQRALCYGCLGLSYEDIKEFAMAHSSYMTALKYNPGQRGLHLNFGRTCLMAGNKAIAEIEFRKELALPDGDHVNARTMMARL